LDRVGKIKDISSEGAAFEYPLAGKHKQANEALVVIFSARAGSLFLRGVPCRVVYDIMIEPPTLNGIQTRRCGLQFNKLSHHQNSKLQDLLNRHVLRSC
jgi:hypothetical protein